MRVLVVEDNDVNMALMQVILRRLKCDVISAYTAKDGVDAAQREQPDLAFVDEGLPDFSGIEATRYIVTLNIPVVMVSANAFEDYRLRALEAGCCAYVTKPISVRQIEMYVQKFRAAAYHDRASAPITSFV